MAPCTFTMLCCLTICWQLPVSLTCMSFDCGRIMAFLNEKPIAGTGRTSKFHWERVRGLQLILRHCNVSPLLCSFLPLSRMEAEEEATAKLCIQKLSLRSLTKEPGITTSQMILCCQRLLEERFPLMEGLNVCVSNFFSVKQDGDICIPWDWKS